MGRETKLLLGLLATLMGVFMGVLSMKLLVRRPPAGAGPDVHADLADVESHELVSPPELDPPSVALIPTAPRFASREAQPLPPARDPLVVPASADVPFDAPPLDEPPTPMPPPQFDPLPSHEPAAEPQPGLVTGGTYVAQAGDSWWSLAERVYGDGRCYRALFAWNRAVDPRVSLVPGTTIELPPAERLQAAWPALIPSP